MLFASGLQQGSRIPRGRKSSSLRLDLMTVWGLVGSRLRCASVTLDKRGGSPSGRRWVTATIWAVGCSWRLHLSERSLKRMGRMRRLSRYVVFAITGSHGALVFGLI